MPETHLYSMSSGVYEEVGRAMPVSYAMVNTPQGKAFFVESCERIVYLSLTEDENAALTEFQKRWNQTKPRHRPEHCQNMADRVFNADDPDSCARLLVLGSDFQIKVWEQLTHIQEGTVTTYKDIAEKIGQPEAALAVANAVAENPIAYLVPCHRAVHTDGSIGAYPWGVESKRNFLTAEGFDPNQLSTA